MLFADKASRELTPLDLQLLEPDLLGAIALVLYGRGPAMARRTTEPRSFEAKPRRAGYDPSRKA